jgi:hypothetical protein
MQRRLRLNRRRTACWSKCAFLIAFARAFGQGELAVFAWLTITLLLGGLAPGWPPFSQLTLTQLPQTTLSSSLIVPFTGVEILGQSQIEVNAEGQNWPDRIAVIDAPTRETLHSLRTIVGSFSVQMDMNGATTPRSPASP